MNHAYLVFSRVSTDCSAPEDRRTFVSGLPTYRHGAVIHITAMLQAQGTFHGIISTFMHRCMLFAPNRLAKMESVGRKVARVKGDGLQPAPGPHFNRYA